MDHDWVPRAFMQELMKPEVEPEYRQQIMRQIVMAEEEGALDRISQRIQSARNAGGSLVAVNVDDLGLLNCAARRLKGMEAALEWYAEHGMIREKKTALVVLGRDTDERLPE